MASLLSRWRVSPCCFPGSMSTASVSGSLQLWGQKSRMVTFRIRRILEITPCILSLRITHCYAGEGIRWVPTAPSKTQSIFYCRNSVTKSDGKWLMETPAISVGRSFPGLPWEPNCLEWHILVGKVTQGLKSLPVTCNQVTNHREGKREALILCVS